MTSFARRRLRNLLITGLAAEVVVLGQARAPRIGDQHFATGWLLAIGFAVLLLFNARKKIPMVPLLTAATWLEVHVYVGLLASFIFFVHTGIHYPSGIFNLALWWGFVMLMGSGMFGIGIERSFAPRLRERGEAILFDRIPSYRLQLADDAERLAARSVAETSSPLLADLYRERIAPFMVQTRNFWPHVLASGKPLERVNFELHAIERYLNPEGRETLGALRERVIAKDNLDHQHALMSVMRGWLFFHIPVAYCVLLMSAVHVVLVYAFGRV
jgi:hypothetical protein